jgi:hypothetical protein
MPSFRDEFSGDCIALFAPLSPLADLRSEFELLDKRWNSLREGSEQGEYLLQAVPLQGVEDTGVRHNDDMKP